MSVATEEKKDPKTASGSLSPEELADRLVPDSPQISADGTLVAFEVGPPSQKGEHREQSIWLSRESGPAEQFTSGTANDASPQWSPDSKCLLFLSDRAERGKNKLYLLKLSGGEARPLGELDGELRAPMWS